MISLTVACHKKVKTRRASSYFNNLKGMLNKLHFSNLKKMQINKSFLKIINYCNDNNNNNNNNVEEVTI